MLVHWLGILILVALFGFLGALLLGIAMAGYAWVAGLVGHPPHGSKDAQDYRPHRPQVPPRVRRAVLARDNYQCVICGSKEDLELDHEIPYSRGGSMTEENLRVLCHKCNISKGAN